MAWTTPRTWVAGDFTDANMLNTHFRDNMSATEAGVASLAAGDLIYASGSHALTRLAAGTSSQYVFGGSTPTFAALDFLHATDATVQLCRGTISSGTLTTLIASGVTACYVLGIWYDTSAGLGTNFRGLIDSSTSLDVGNATSPLLLTVAGGALKIQRTAGTRSFDYAFVAIYR